MNILLALASNSRLLIAILKVNWECIPKQALLLKIAVSINHSGRSGSAHNENFVSDFQSGV